MQSKPRHRDAKDLKGNGLKLTSNPQPDTIKLSRDPMSMESMMVEYASTDMFGDYTFSPLVSLVIYLFMSIYDVLIRTWLLLSSYIVYHNILYQHFGTNTFVCILYIWQWFSYWESSCLYIDFYGSQSDEKWYVPCGHMHHKLYTQGSPMFPLSLRERRYFKIARRDEVFVGSTRVIFTIPVGTRVTSGCFIASQV